MKELLDLNFHIGLLEIFVTTGSRMRSVLLQLSGVEKGHAKFTGGIFLVNDFEMALVEEKYRSSFSSRISI